MMVCFKSERVCVIQRGTKRSAYVCTLEESAYVWLIGQIAVRERVVLLVGVAGKTLSRSISLGCWEPGGVMGAPCIGESKGLVCYRKLFARHQLAACSASG